MRLTVQSPESRVQSRVEGSQRLWTTDYGFWTVIFVAALMLSGCGTFSRPNGGNIDLTHAENLERQGRTKDALLEYARLARSLAQFESSDVLAKVGMARILGALARMRAWEMEATLSDDERRGIPPLDAWLDESLLTSGRASRWADVLASVPPSVQIEGARAIAACLESRLQRPELRNLKLGEADGPLLDVLYRILIGQCLVHLERYALNRMPEGDRDPSAALAAMERLRADIGRIESMPHLKAAAAEYWRERAESVGAGIRELRSDGSPVNGDRDSREFAEADPQTHLRLAAEYDNRATQAAVARSDPKTILANLERSLRHAAYARECIVEPDSAALRTLQTVPVIADKLRRQCSAD
ncbi:MAG: hypothetical protein HY716_13915 [Planctomycetes bacterium]|nr:hypothetical protein [Planctomycetota bacterium]